MLTRTTEDDWTVVLEVFRAVRSRRGDKGRDDRRFLETLHYFTMHNITWRAPPAEFGSWNSVWKRFWWLSQSGIFEPFFQALAECSRTAGIVQMFDSTSIRAYVLFPLDWINDPKLRRTAGQELNKGESRNSLSREVFIRRRGEIRDPTYENQQHRASGLNFLVAAIILWTTRYLERAIAVLRQIENIPDHLPAHLSPHGWEQVYLIGDYVWGAAEQMTESPDRFQPLRMLSEPAALAP